MPDTKPLKFNFDGTYPYLCIGLSSCFKEFLKNIGFLIWRISGESWYSDIWDRQAMAVHSDCWTPMSRWSSTSRSWSTCIRFILSLLGLSIFDLKANGFAVYIFPLDPGLVKPFFIYCITPPISALAWTEPLEVNPSGILEALRRGDNLFLLTVSCTIMYEFCDLSPTPGLLGFYLSLASSRGA